VERIRQAGERLVENVSRVIVGKEEALRLAVVALLCQGHALVEDVPGVGKTTLVRAMARSLGLSFKRIQFTPDLLPSDVTGVNWYNQKKGEFEFLAGPVMGNLILADEINRATPRTQASLLEAMEERQITVDNQTMALPRPFIVLATQNPVELEGTFPLPEAQLDRFLLRISHGYPTAEEESAILTRFERINPLNELEPVVDRGELLELQDGCRLVRVEDSVRDYMVGLVRATREHRAVRLGASPRAGQGLFASARALAALSGRSFVIPDDVKSLAGPVLAHRLMVEAQARLRGSGQEGVVREVLEQVPAPVE
jgi:MoxR-like ATPase